VIKVNSNEFDNFLSDDGQSYDLIKVLEYYQPFMFQDCLKLILGIPLKG